MAGLMDTAEVMALVDAAQQGAAEEVRRAAEGRMLEMGGSIADGPAGLHFVRVIAFRVVGDWRAALAASDLMLTSAERAGAAGWRAIALSLRARLRIVLGDNDLAEYDIDAVLRDLTAAEAALAGGVADLLVGSTAHNAIAIGYDLLRLYELAAPQYAAAYELYLQLEEPDNPGPAICQTNLAQSHLMWALELYRVGEVAEAEKHSLVAESHALQAARDTPASSTGYRRELADLLVGCARADGADPAGAAAQIQTYGDRIWKSQRLDEWLFSRPFLAVALARSGRRDEALAVVEHALAELPSEAEWSVTAALNHTHAVLLAQTGAPQLQAVLRYGNGLAGTLWRQRQRTLNTAETLRSYERLRTEHEHVKRSAETDTLTGVANRRAFERALTGLADGAGAGAPPIAVLVIDLDKFKPLNDTHGHAAGDQALRMVAEALGRQVRDGDLLARTGGDEFCALLAGADNQGAVKVAERMVHAVRDLHLTVTVSIGIATGPSVAIAETLHRADQAMYAAKRAGGDQTRAAPPLT
jgi:diguanylate cyclase (GGDEF)-like protein